MGKNHIPALKNIAADFPYFQSVQLLLTKALYNEKHYEFEKQLKYASLMLPDRAVFFRYIHNMTEAAIQQAVPVEIPEPVIESAMEEQMVEEMIIPEEIVPEVEPIILAAEPEIIEPVIEDKIEAIAEIIEIEPAPVEVIIPVPEVEPTPEVTAADPNETHSFAEWLKMQADHTYKPAETPKIPVAEAKTVQPEEQTAETPDLSMQEQIAGQVERSSNVTEFESILDKFIRENPRITRGKAEFYSPMNMAKQSVEQDEELVSETLANIYYKQGHFKKAIRMYEKLCLLYPHKLPYFADLIQKIKTENKD